jgi:hypothetical protein
LAVAAVLATTTAHADEREGVRWSDIKDVRANDESGVQKRDTTYGRIDGDLALVFGVGATVAPRAPRPALDLRFRYVDTVGIFAGYEDGVLFKSDAEPRRVFAAGVELRPIFLARWLRGMEFQSAYPDLFVDSFGLELGAFFAQPQGAAFGSRPGLQAGVGLEIPIFPRASGPWIGLHGGVRWSDSALSGNDLDGPADRSAYLTITAAWHQTFGAHVVDFGDDAPR